MFTVPFCIVSGIDNCVLGNLYLTIRHHQISNMYPTMNFRLRERKWDIACCKVFDQHSTDEEQSMKYCSLLKFLI